MQRCTNLATPRLLSALTNGEARAYMYIYAHIHTHTHTHAHTQVLFSHCLHHNRRALLYMRRAEYLLRIIGGADHPDVAALYINTAMIYLDLNEIKTALRYMTIWHIYVYIHTSVYVYIHTYEYIYMYIYI